MTDTSIPLIPIDARTLWLALEGTPGIEVGLVQANGRVVAGHASMYFGSSFEGSARVRHARDLRDERLGFIQRTITERRPLLVRHLSGGVRLETVIHPLEELVEGWPGVLLISREGLSDPGDLEIVESAFVDLGRLDVLTNRELEVLALLGKGMQIGEIGQALFRSPKTVEKHRAAISRKLGVASRAELARLVQRAALETEDARRARIRSTSSASDN